MGRRRSGCILMALGVVLAVIAGIISFLVVGTKQAAPVVEIPKRGVLVAASNIPERTLLNPSLLRVQQWPQDNIPPGALSTVEEGDKKYTTMPLFAGEPVLQAQVADTSGNSGMSYALEKGKVLVSVNLGGAAGIASTGALRPGDAVDLVVTMPGARGTQVAYTMQNLKIYSIGSVAAKAPANPAAPATTAAGTLFIFEVTPQDALIMKYLETLNVDLVLRAAADDQLVPTEPVTLDYVINRYRLQRPPTP